ncbi:MAG: rod shape-determining protein MreD [Pseudomonadota bacterium]|nr:rod shape-determining protein MreD [Pseudomonadota bacterium]
MDRISYDFNKRSAKGSGWIFILCTVIVGFMLIAIPLPSWASIWRPAWIALLIFYWGITSPEKVGVIFSFCTGLFLDVYHGGTLGEHALALSVVSLVAITYSKRFRLYPSLQQSLFVGLVLLVYVVSIRKIQNFDAPLINGFDPFSEAISSALLWPWFALILNDLARRFTLR